MSDKFKKALTISLLAMQIVIPVLVLAQPTGDPFEPGGTEPDIDNICKVYDLVARVARILLVFLIILAVIFVILAAFKYLTAGGDAEKVKAANAQILYAAIAVAVGLLATSVPRIVMYFLDANISSCEEGIGASILGS